MADPAPDPELSRRNVRLGVVVLLVLVGFVGFNLVRNARSNGEPPALPAELRASLQQGGCTVDSRYDKGQKHVDSVAYSVNPPAGGDHAATPARAGFYDTANAPADANLVHSLEHGFVIVWYRPDGVEAAAVDRLRELARLHRWVLVVARPSLPGAVAASAWHRRLLCPASADALGTDALSAAGPIGTFVTAFRDQGPEKGFI